MVVRGTRRPRPERPTGTIRLLMAGLVLAFSTNEVFAIDERRGLIVVPLQDQDDLVGIVRALRRG